MLNLFYNKNDTLFGVKIDSKISYIREMITTEKIKIKNYYASKEASVVNNHLLVRLIKTMNVDYKLEIWDYLKIVDATAIYVAKNFDIVSNNHSGCIRDSIFYGDNSKEVLLYREDEWDVYDLIDAWDTTASVKTMYCGNTSVWMHPPSNNIDFDFETLSIFTIDIRMLMVQYKTWALRRLDNDLNTNPAVFIYKYVLPNMIDSLIDYAVFNRFVKIFNGEDIDNGRNKHPFGVRDLSKNIDSILEKIGFELEDSSIQYEHFLTSIPGLCNENMYDALRLDVFLYNKQSRWVVWLARLPYILDIIEIAGVRGLRKNKHLIDDLRVGLKALERNHVFTTKLDGYTELEYIVAIEELHNLLGRR